jgi:hypothetical protein
MGGEGPDHAGVLDTRVVANTLRGLGLGVLGPQRARAKGAGTCGTRLRVVVDGD